MTKFLIVDDTGTVLHGSRISSTFSTHQTKISSYSDMTITTVLYILLQYRSVHTKFFVGKHLKVAPKGVETK